MPKSQYVADLKVGEPVRSRFCITGVNPAAGAAPHRFRLRDRTGEIAGIAWPARIDAALLGSPFVDVDGMATLYYGKPQVEVESIRPVAATDEPGEFLPAYRGDLDDLKRTLRILVHTIRQPALKAVCAHLFADPGFRRAYYDAPAAQYMHHPYVGGLLEHSLEVAQLADAAAGVMPHLNRDLLVTAALLHDVGKLDELDWSTGCIRYSRAGGMVGHVALGMRRIDAALAAVGEQASEVGDALCHLLLSHHGKKEYGAPVEPIAAEAYVLHACDDLSAKSYHCRIGLEGAQPGEVFRKVQGLTNWLYTGVFGGEMSGTDPKPRVLEAPVGYDPEPGLRIVSGAAPSTVVSLQGSVAAGYPDRHGEAAGERYALPQTGRVQEGDFLLRLRGDSMVGAHLLDGDVVLVRPRERYRAGEIVVALVDGESTVKYLEGSPGAFRLRAANPAYPDFVPDEELRIDGAVVGVLRGLV